MQLIEQTPADTRIIDNLTVANIFCIYNRDLIWEIMTINESNTRTVGTLKKSSRPTYL